MNGICAFNMLYASNIADDDNDDVYKLIVGTLPVPFEIISVTIEIDADTNPDWIDVPL